MHNAFSPASVEVVELAERQARRFNHPHVGTEHLLLGVVDHRVNPAAEVLAEYGVSLTSLHNQLHFILGEGPPQQLDRIPLTATAAHVLEAAEAQARERGDAMTEPAHIVLALVAENASNLGADILLSLGVPLGELVQDTITALSTPTATAPLPAPFRPAGSQLLDQFGRNLTRDAALDALDPLIGRDREIHNLTRTLSRRNKNNPVLIGDAGVGKTAIVEGLARKIAFREVPMSLRDKQVYAIDVASMVAGSRYRGDFEERFKKVLTEVRERGDIILFVDEVHTIVGAGAAEGSIDAANIMKPILSRGEIKLIGATTPSEYRQTIEKDSALSRRFQRIDVDEPTPVHTRMILLGLRPLLEAHHQVSITESAIDAAIELACRYLPARFLPDKAIDLVDEAAAEVALRLDAPESGVQADDVAAVLAEQTGIPVAIIGADEAHRLTEMPVYLHERLVGIDQAIEAVTKSIKRGRTGIRDPGRPAGSFIFAGSTGVGKTELAKALAEFLFGDDSHLIRFDMSEFTESHSISRLIGSPPGYVGYDDGGQLTEKVLRKPFSVVLFDEVEKAHIDIFNILLQVLDDGHLNDSSGRRVDFTNTVIILTTNLGTRAAAKGPIGFAGDGDGYRYLTAMVTSAIKQHFSPEFLNRLDDVIVFPQLTRENLCDIVDLQLVHLAERLARMNITLTVTESAREVLADFGGDLAEGARPVRRAIRTYIEDPLSDMVLSEKVKPGQAVRLDVDGDRVVLRTVAGSDSHLVAG
ncbi:ATP-dependent Clp protease ATP-binding subunit [Nocardia sp. CS682]|uniref:ATP-dependent Clp protease ATP-binding subunit n=1 Tax=Nocardia sp. CS682 TaxID=1047172 RepID=UPI001074A36C|nr:ATP-dependent Clp protease ATP-binding subunit [Nocardia sp. CS682]QBS44893.1 chaperone protein ClpB [Nocardia sp. CS682]